MFRAFRAARLASRQSIRSYSTEAHASPIKSDLPYIVSISSHFISLNEVVTFFIYFDD